MHPCWTIVQAADSGWLGHSSQAMFEQSGRGVPAPRGAARKGKGVHAPCAARLDCRWTEKRLWQPSHLHTHVSAPTLLRMLVTAVSMRTETPLQGGETHWHKQRTAMSNTPLLFHNNETDQRQQTQKLLLSL